MIHAPCWSRLRPTAGIHRVQTFVSIRDLLGFDILSTARRLSWPWTIRDTSFLFSQIIIDVIMLLRERNTTPCAVPWTEDSSFDDLTESVSMGRYVDFLQHHKPKTRFVSRKCHDSQTNSSLQELARLQHPTCTCWSNSRESAARLLREPCTSDHWQNGTTVCPESPLQRDNQVNLVSEHQQ